MPFIGNPLDPKEPALWSHCRVCLGIWTRKKQMERLLELAAVEEGHIGREALLLAALDTADGIYDRLRETKDSQHVLDYHGATQLGNGTARLGDVLVAAVHAPEKAKACNRFNRAAPGLISFVRFGRNAAKHADPPPEAPLVFPMDMTFDMKTGRSTTVARCAYVRFYEEGLADLDPQPSEADAADIRAFAAKHKHDLATMLDEVAKVVTAAVHDYVRRDVTSPAHK